MVRPASFGFNPDTAPSFMFQREITENSRKEIERRARMEFDILAGRFDARAAASARFVEAYVDEVMGRMLRLALSAFTGDVSQEQFELLASTAGFRTAGLFDNRERLIAALPATPQLIGTTSLGDRLPTLRHALDGTAGVSDVITSVATGERIAFFAVPFFAAEAFLAGDDFFAVDLLAVFLVVPPPAARFAAAAVRRTVGFAAFGVARSTAATVSAGSFFVPATTSLSCAPALKFGTAFFFDFIRAPVAGFRTHRAERTFFSKEPKPVMATFSPLATSRVIVSSTESSACAAALRLPSYRAARASIN